MTQKYIEKTHTLQQDQSDCGVACLLSLIKFNEGTNTIEKLRELSGTSKQGTTLFGLYQAASAVGFTAEGCEKDFNNRINSQFFWSLLHLPKPFFDTRKSNANFKFL